MKRDGAKLRLRESTSEAEAMRDLLFVALMDEAEWVAAWLVGRANESRELLKHGEIRMMGEKRKRIEKGEGESITVLSVKEREYVGH